MVFQLFHVTTADRAARILKEGFKDGRGKYLTDQVFEGVWLSDQPLSENEGAKGDTVLEVRSDVRLSELDYWEWKQENKPYREWLIPAEYINKNATITKAAPCIFGGSCPTLVAAVRWNRRPRSN
jgi:hypothetical protein